MDDFLVAATIRAVNLLLNFDIIAISNFADISYQITEQSILEAKGRTIGHYADLQLQNATTHYPYAEIPVWVIMPNHLHAIVTIRRRAVAHRGPTTTPTNGPSNDGAVKPTDDTGDIRMRSVAAQQGWLSYCIYKARPEIY